MSIMQYLHSLVSPLLPKIGNSKSHCHQYMQFLVFGVVLELDQSWFRGLYWGPIDDKNVTLNCPVHLVDQTKLTQQVTSHTKVSCASCRSTAYTVHFKNSTENTFWCLAQQFWLGHVQCSLASSWPGSRCNQKKNVGSGQTSDQVETYVPKSLHVLITVGVPSWLNTGEYTCNVYTIELYQTVW